MATATASHCCRVCNGAITVKSRRKLFVQEFMLLEELCEVLGYMPSENDNGSQYACYLCWGALSKLKKLNNDLVEKLIRDRQNLVKKLKDKHISNCSCGKVQKKAINVF
ncbi:hypothetical protein LOTGIDRAFT_164216 [Lottia gigantea]|uniref:ZAD domain-containing protein n=1 Tax=Lottia gigantea TaxID=225164 RepID=V4AAG4_LOTGI|nr:hypothetical protein LOTGIDRAFT_164216 [Lottia gigantea]ESO90296.1 hypothetical protein LOTGIDRAFT_164216 [Lottia gigantea]